jgi:hypothetical protein
MQQMATNGLDDSTCAGSGAFYAQPVGGEINLTRDEVIGTGAKFEVGGGAHASAITRTKLIMPPQWAEAACNGSGGAQNNDGVQRVLRKRERDQNRDVGGN